MIKKLLLLLVISMGIVHVAWATPPRVPSFENDFASKLTTPNEKNAEHTSERVYNLNIDPDRSLEENIRNLFYPSAAGGGMLWDYVRTIGVAIFFIFLVWIGIQFLMSADDESKLEKSKKHFIRLLYGAFLYFGAVWILGTALKITGGGGSAALVNNFQNNFWFQLLAFFKTLAFFAAILGVLLAGYRMMHAMGQEEQLKAAKTGIVNVLIALVALKVIDFIYLLAMDNDFFNEIRLWVVKLSRLLGYGIGIAILASIFVAGYYMITDGGSGEGAKKAGKIIQTVAVVGLTIFLFLLITYQIIAQFA